MAVRLKIADTYKRKVEIELPGTGTEPEKHTITVTYRDIDPEQLQTDEERLASLMKSLYQLMDQLKSGKQDPATIDPIVEDLKGAESITPKIDAIFVGVEGLEVIGRDDKPLEGDDLVDFCKRYPRIKNAILKKYAEENEAGESAALGNLLRSVKGGRA
jgi:hypothetical protein